MARRGPFVRGCVSVGVGVGGWVDERAGEVPSSCCLLIWLKSDSLTSLVIERDQSTDASLLALRQTEAAQHRQPPPVLESCFFFAVVSI